MGDFESEAEWNDNDGGKLNVSGEMSVQYQCHCSYRKSQIGCPEIELRAPRW
jgi:hypothetical protein